VAGLVARPLSLAMARSPRNSGAAPGGADRHFCAGVVGRVAVARGLSSCGRPRPPRRGATQPAAAPSGPDLALGPAHARLAAGVGGIHAPRISEERHAAERGDGVDDEQRPGRAARVAKAAAECLRRPRA
jgi:hypothetical protein